MKTHTISICLILFVAAFGVVAAKATAQEHTTTHAVPEAIMLNDEQAEDGYATAKKTAMEVFCDSEDLLQEIGNDMIAIDPQAYNTITYSAEEELGYALKDAVVESILKDATLQNKLKELFSSSLGNSFFTGIGIENGLVVFFVEAGDYSISIYYIEHADKDFVESMYYPSVIQEESKLKEHWYYSVFWRPRDSSSNMDESALP